MLLQEPASPDRQTSPTTAVRCESAHAANAWNRLWSVVPGRLPTLRGECLQRFIQQFGNRARIHLLHVQRDGQLAAALPLLGHSKGGLPVSVSLPLNPWMKCGCLLVDPGFAHDRQVFAELARQMEQVPGWLFDFQWIRPSDNWDQLLQQLENNGWTVGRQTQFVTGLITIDGTWDDYLASRSKAHRKHMRVALRRLEQTGHVTFERHHSIEDKNELNRLLDEALQIEHAGWKGDARSSIRSHAEIEAFYRDVAELLNRHGMLELQFLRIDGRAIAFELGYHAGTTYFSHKVGFDPAYARFSPGQLLMYLQLQNWFAEHTIKTIDTMGILSDATAKWCTETQTSFRYRAIRPGLVPRLVWKAARWLRRLKPSRSPGDS